MLVLAAKLHAETIELCAGQRVPTMLQIGDIMDGSFFAGFVPGTTQPRLSLVSRTGALELTRIISEPHFPGLHCFVPRCRHHGL